MHTIQSILSIEDSPEDFEATSRALRKAGMTMPLHHCKNGDDGLAFLAACLRPPASQENISLPSLILLDLNLPGTDGRDILRTIKSNESFRHIPVIILSTSNNEADVKSCYERGANAYLRKPYNLAGFMDIATALKTFWAEQVLFTQ